MAPRDPAFRTEAGVCVARLADDVDLAVADAIEAAVVGNTDTGVPLVVDLTQGSFLDSAGVRLLDRLAGRHLRAGSGVRVVAPTGGPPRMSLGICEFPPDLLAETVDAALASLTPHR
jgi:anti-anti-sigma factor